MTDYGKTLRGLLATTDFDSISEVINADTKPHWTSEQFREAYDRLLSIEQSDEECIDIEVKRYETCWSSVQIEGCPWEDFIDGEIYIEEGPQVSDAELAYTLLWNLCYYGYNAASKKAIYEQMTNGGRHNSPYGYLAYEAEIHRDFVLADRETKRDIINSVRRAAEEGWMQYALTEEQWDAIAYHRKHCNGPKRKRDARLLRRIKRYDALDGRIER